MKSHEKIIKKIEEIEKNENVRVIYACESGSRAWGFASEDSDYDVRFLYVHPKDRYLSILDRRDVIETPIVDQLDIQGWDIRKALRLFRKSNPPLLEWLQSPIVYSERYRTASVLRDFISEFYSPVSCFYHYLHMARGNYRDYLKDNTVWLKKYFYVLRPVLACKWIELELGVVPIEFKTLVDRIIQKDSALGQEIDKLLIQKRSGFELSRGPKIKVIGDFLETELNRLESKPIRTNHPNPEVGKLDRLFCNTLDEAWGML